LALNKLDERGESVRDSPSFYNKDILKLEVIIKSWNENQQSSLSVSRLYILKKE
jgi:hypothetical protein